MEARSAARRRRRRRARPTSGGGRGQDARRGGADRRPGAAEAGDRLRRRQGARSPCRSAGAIAEDVRRARRVRRRREGRLDRHAAGRDRRLAGRRLGRFLRALPDLWTTLDHQRRRRLLYGAGRHGPNQRGGRPVRAGGRAGRRPWATARRRTAAAAAIGAAQPILYIELRKDGAAIDPGPWWAKSDIEKARG